MYYSRLLGSRQTSGKIYPHPIGISGKLQQSNEETKRANQAKSEFLSHMSHDIRTPINGIMGMVEIIKKNLDDPERIKDCLEKIDKASHHLLSLINDVLDMSKIGSGKVHLEEIPVDLDEEMEKIHAIADVQAKKQEIKVFLLRMKLSTDSFLAVRAHLRRILLNLISNALRYNKKGERSVWPSGKWNMTDPISVWSLRFRIQELV